MAFITKEAILNNFNRCSDMLDKFNDLQLAAIYDFISILNSTGNSYTLSNTPDRVCILKYLCDLKNNKNKANEDVVYDRLRSIHTAMAAMTLLQLKYDKFTKPGKKTITYQILQLDKDNINVIADRRMFASWDELNSTCGFSKLCYKKVYEGEIEPGEVAKVLDTLFTKFNMSHPNEFTGHSLSVSDVIILDGVMYYCDSYRWINIKTGKPI